MKQKEFEQRLAALEAIISQNSITLTDANTPNQQLVMTLNNGEFKMFKRTVSVTEAEINLSSLNINE